MEKGQVKTTKTKEIKTRELVNWDADEYIHRDRQFGWYIGFFVVVAALVVLSVFLQWWSFTALIALSAVALFIYVIRPPRKLHYSLTTKGLSEGNRTYKFEEYKAFGVLQDGQDYAIVLTPIKRFSPRVTVYFPKESGEKIVDAFGARLPMEEVKLDFLDKVVRMLRI